MSSVLVLKEYSTFNDWQIAGLQCLAYFKNLKILSKRTNEKTRTSGYRIAHKLRFIVHCVFNVRILNGIPKFFSFFPKK